MKFRVSWLLPKLARLKPFFGPTAITVGTITLTAALFALSPTILESIELNWLDLRFRVRGPLVPSPEVVLVAVDEKSMATEGRWPWPRTRIAALIDALSRDGARVIGFDVVFSEPQQDARLGLINQIEQTVERAKTD